MNGYALSHFQWNSQKVLVSDCSLKRLALNANRDTDLITETKMNGPRGSKALLQASPSGDYVTVYWPEVLFYMIYDARSSSMEEIERGYCSEFAWTGPHNHFIIKTPAYYQVDKPTVRRSSIVNAFFKAEKVSKTYKPSELIAKQCLDKVTSPVVLESFDDQFHLIDLFSGNCLIANVVNKTTENNQLAMFQNPNPDTNLIPPKRTIFNFTESRLFAMKKKGGEDSSMELVTVGPKALPGVMQLAWDYERSYVSLLHTNGCINVLHIDQNKCNSLLSLQSASPLCSFQCLSWFANCFAVCTYNQIHLHFVEEQNNQTTNQFIPLEQNPLSKFIPATEVVGSHQGFLFGSSK